MPTPITTFERREPTYVPPHRYHDPRLTFGIELEMLIPEILSEEEGMQMVLESLEKLHRSGRVAFGAEIFTDGTPDRTKFLVMKDKSINPRIRPKEDVPLPPPPTEEELEAERLEEEAGAADESEEPWGWTGCWRPQPTAALKAVLCPLDEEDDERIPHVPRLSKEEREEKRMKDYHLTVEDPKFHMGAPVEICTPVLKQITYELALTSTLFHISQDLGVQFNQTVGLHVHVGCGYGSCWSLEELKAIGKATILWEFVIDLMHAAHRSRNRWMIASNRHNPSLGDLTLTEAFEAIDEASSFATFYNVIGDSKFYKYNFLSNSGYGTVEFRQAEAHNDVERAIGWVRFISHFVSAALTTQRWEWEEWAAAVGRGLTDTRLLRLHARVWKRFGIPNSLREEIILKWEEKWGVPMPRF